MNVETKLVDELLESGLVSKTNEICEAFYSAGSVGAKSDKGNTTEEPDKDEVGKYVPQGGDYDGPQDEAMKKLVYELSLSSAMIMKASAINVKSILSAAGAKLTDQIRKNLSEIASRLDSDSDYLVKLKNDFEGKGSGDSEEEHEDDSVNDERSDNKSGAEVPDIKSDVSGIDAMIQ